MAAVQAWGYVNADGSLVIGEGLTSSRVAQGVYRIHFNEAVDQEPAVVAMTHALYANSIARRLSSLSPVPNTVDIVTSRMAADGQEHLFDMNFSLIASFRAVQRKRKKEKPAKKRAVSRSTRSKKRPGKRSRKSAKAK